jgi:hypothetical protein
MHYYNPSLIFYLFGTVLGILTVAIYFVGLLMTFLLEDSMCWQTVVLKLGIMAGAITILAVIAKMIKIIKEE